MRVLNLLRFVALSVVLFSVSCKKRGHFEVPCKIEQIISRYQYDPHSPAEVNVSTFTNNAWGDPVSIIQSNPITGRPHYYFYYDNHRRLTTFKGEYGPGVIENYTRYFYDNNHFIVRDTTYFSGSDINNPASFYQIIVGEYSYDSKGRVSKVAYHVVGVPHAVWEYNYSYDAQGNMIRPGATYDNKTNYLRTSLVLAFVNRDYSMNNYIPAQTYNSKNLPTSYPVAATGVSVPQFFNIAVTEIEYTCDNNDND